MEAMNLMLPEIEQAGRDARAYLSADRAAVVLHARPAQARFPLLSDAGKQSGAAVSA